MKSNIADKEMQKIRQALAAQQKEKRDPKILERAIKAETEGMGFFQSERKANEIREQWQMATEKTTGFMSGFLKSLVGDKAGKLLAKKYAKADDDQVKQAQEFFEKYKKQDEKKDKVSAKKSERASKEFKSLKKAVTDIQKNVGLIRKSLTGKSAPSVKEGYFFDPRMAGGGRFKESATNKIVSKDVALKRTEDLTKAIQADENPMIKLTETVEAIYKSLGKETRSKNVHEKLDSILINSGEGGFGLSDLLGGGGGRNRRGRKGGNRGRRGRFGRGIGLGGLLAGAAGGYLAYSAVDSLRDPNLVAEDPETLKEEAIMARESGDTGATSAIQDQITAQKRDIKLQAGATAAGVAGAVGGAVAVKKIADTAAVKNVKSKAWNLFVNFVKKKAPKLFAKIGARLALAGGLATVPVLGWITAAVTVVGSIWMAYDLYQLWQEFSALDDAEKELYDEKVQETKSTGEVGAAAPVAAAAALPSAAMPTASAGVQPPTAATPPPTTPTQQPSFKSIVTSGVRNAIAAVKSGIGGGSATSQDLKKYVRLKDSSVQLDGLNEQLKTRFANLAKEYYEKTGKKIQVNSGYRSTQEQAALYAKLGPPKAAPPGRSRHESGLAIDINSPDANKAIELGLMAKYGFTRPVRGETWHVEPVESAKRGGTPDNPYKPGTPAVVANNGKEVNPQTGAAMTASTSKGVKDSGSAATPAPSTPPPAATTNYSAAAASPTSTPSPTTAGDAAAPVAPVMAAAPVPNTSGSEMQQQSKLLASNQMQMQATPAPVVNNVVNQSAPAAPPPQPTNQLTKAMARTSDNSFLRALARDFSHPSAFTTISMT